MSQEVMHAPPSVISVIILILSVLMLLAFTMARRTPASVKKFNERERTVTRRTEVVSFQDKVIVRIQQRPGYWGRPGREHHLIEVYKGSKLVGLVRCCEDPWAITPSLVNELAKLKIWYKVKVVYIASGGTIPATARSEANYRKIKLMRIED